MGTYEPTDDDEALRKRILARLTPQARMEGLTLEDRLKGLSLEQIERLRVLLNERS